MMFGGGSVIFHFSIVQVHFFCYWISLYFFHTLWNTTLLCLLFIIISINVQERSFFSNYDFCYCYASEVRNVKKNASPRCLSKFVLVFELFPIENIESYARRNSRSQVVRLTTAWILRLYLEVTLKEFLQGRRVFLFPPPLTTPEYFFRGIFSIYSRLKWPIQIAFVVTYT